MAGEREPTSTHGEFSSLGCTVSLLFGIRTSPDSCIVHIFLKVQLRLNVLVGFVFCLFSGASVPQLGLQDIQVRSAKMEFKAFLAEMGQKPSPEPNTKANNKIQDYVWMCNFRARSGM